MSWRLVARQALRESHRSWELPGVVGLFALLFGAVAYRLGPGMVASGSADPLLGYLYLLCSVLVPATALMGGQRTVAGRREDGRLRLLLGQPLSRRDVVLGHYAAEAATIAAAILVATAIALLAAALAAGALPTVAPVLEFAVLATVLGLAYLGIAIAISASRRTTEFTGFLAFGVFLLFIFVWRLVPTGVVYLVNGFSFPPRMPDWATYVEVLSPSVAWETLLDASLGDGAAALWGGTSEVTLALVVMAWWVVLLPALAIARFEASDL